MSAIFISHAAKDEVLVEEFMDLLQVGIGVHPDDIFCSSLPGMGIPTGKEFINYIKAQVTNPDFVLLMISSEFLKSQFCHHEVGASWALSLPIYPIIVPPLDYPDVRGVLVGTQMAKLDNKESLNDLRDDLTDKLGLKPYRTSHWERKRDKFLARMQELLQLPTDASKEAVMPEKGTPASVITNSGPWLKLHDRYYMTELFEHQGKTSIVLRLLTGSAEDDAALNHLRPDRERRGSSVGFAFQNEGGFARIDKVTSASKGDGNVWSIEMTIEDSPHGSVLHEMSYNSNNQHYSSDDIAEMRAGRLLINDPPPLRRRSKGFHDEFLESMIVGSDELLSKADQCIIQKVISENRDNLADALNWARLEAVFRLKATRTVESVLELSLGPNTGKSLHVRFRGLRPSRYHGESPETITIEGECELP